MRGVVLTISLAPSSFILVLFGVAATTTIVGIGVEFICITIATATVGIIGSVIWGWSYCCHCSYDNMRTLAVTLLKICSDQVALII